VKKTVKIKASKVLLILLAIITISILLVSYYNYKTGKIEMSDMVSKISHMKILSAPSDLPEYTVGVTADKLMGVAQEKEVTFTFSLANFTGFPATDVAESGAIPQNGISMIKAILQYDDNVFEPIDSNNGVVTTITSTGDLSIMGLNDWNSASYNPDGNDGEKVIFLQAQARFKVC